MSKFIATQEQQEILSNDKQNLIVSASAGSGKTTVLVEYIRQLIVEEKVPIKKLLVLTFTNVAGQEMKERLLKVLSQEKQTKFLLQQIDDLPTADICTIDSFCEKIIKRNIDKVQLDECFSVLDSSQSLKLKSQAFQEALNTYLAEEVQGYTYVYTAFKKNKNSIFDCLCYIENFLDSLNQQDLLVQKILHNQEEFFEESCLILNKYYSDLLSSLLEKLNFLNLTSANIKYISVIESLKKSITQINCQTLQEMCKIAKQVLLPNMPVLKVEDRDENLAKSLSSIKDEIKKILESLDKFNFENQELVIAQKNSRLAKNIIELYKIYKSIYQQIKQENDFLDFADIEKLCSQLLQQPDILQALQESFLYTFIDEYQDTNFLQEEIIKKIASGGRFVGVGDPKQAIYGFRNATMEIMKRDINNNLSNPKGNVVFLKGNFRSDKRVLDFVNSVFKVLMREDNTGIDYQGTSMLDGKADYYINSDKAVEICFVHDKCEKKEELDSIYSVRSAELVEKDSDRLEAKSICAKIDDLLTKQIYDIKQQCWRDVELGDIVVLMRGRGSLMQTISNELSTKGYPVLADDKEALTDDSEIQMLISLLKFCLDEKDSLAFVSLLLSKIGDMCIDEIAEIATQVQEQSDLLEFLKQSNNNKVQRLFDNIQIFKKESMLKGIRRAYETLFDRTNYFAYLRTLSQEKVEKVERFLLTISQSEFDNSMASLLSYLNNLSSVKVQDNESDSNAINLMTIHGSKGMEFPIVMLAGCGKNLSSPNKTPYIITEKLGLATMEYDSNHLIKVRTPQLETSRLLKKKSEYIDELMIFYVALTRAKNKLILTGTYDIEDYSLQDCQDFYKGKSYFDWIVMSLSSSERKSINSNEIFENDLAKFVKVDEVQDLQFVDRENLIVEEDEVLTSKINDYLNFVYKNINLSKVEFKNSVTGLLKLEIDDKPELQDYQVYSQSQLQGFTASEIGTIYHEVLKNIEFSQIKNIEDLKTNLQTLIETGFISLQEKNVLDIDILYKDIQILQKLTKNKQVYKEKPFIMKLKLNEISNINSTDCVLVQGVVDMFAFGDENILVDYKYTNINNTQKLLEKYSKQLILYSKAIEKGYKIKLNKKYIFSIKNGQLIEFFE